MLTTGKFSLVLGFRIGQCSLECFFLIGHQALQLAKLLLVFFHGRVQLVLNVGRVRVEPPAIGAALCPG
jgi:hypothetical protein